MALLPHYFYDINAITDEGRIRWFDEFSDEQGSIIELPMTAKMRKSKERYHRNQLYSAWIAAKYISKPDGERANVISPKMMKFQVIRVLAYKHSESNRKDWWENYQDAVFRVFVQPETIYDGKEHKQWYVLSPEDAYLVNRYEISKTNIIPPRDYTKEKYLSNDRRLRTARLIPVECCHHLRHETTAGKLPVGL